MRILSFNANGLRSAASKGFFGWFAAQDMDGVNGNRVFALPHERLRALLHKFNRLKP